MIDMLISGLAEMIAVALEALVDLILPLFSFDFTLFNESFPFAKTAYTIFQSIGLGIAFLLASISVIPFFFKSKRNRTTPVHACLLAILAVGGVYYGNYILTAIMDIAQMPYNALMNANIQYGSLESIIEVNSMMSVIYDACYQQSLILYLCLICLIGIAFVKLLLEAVERYSILFVLIYTSPLAAGTLASEVTRGICKRFFTMFISQCILLILNVWSLQMITSLFANLGNAANPMVTLLIGYAFLRIASRLDSYLNSLGLNAAVTGAGLGAELMSAGMALVATGSSFKGGNAVAGSGGILGVSRQVGNVIGKINPISGAADGIRNMAGAAGQTAVAAGRTAYESVANGGSVKEGMNAFKTRFKSDFAKNVHTADMKTQNSSLWARGMGQAAAGANPSAKSVDQTLDTIFANGSVSEQERNDIATTPFAANRAFSSVPKNTEVNDSTIVASTIQGLGVHSGNPDMTEAIQVGLGNINAEQTEYSMTSEGAQMSYTMNGKRHTWNVRNDEQMANLSAKEQSAYTKVRSNGHNYYVKHTNQNDRMGEAFQKMQKEHSSIQLTDSNKNQFSDLVNAERWKGISQKTQTEITTAIYGQDSNISGGMDSRRFWVESQKGYGVSIISANGLSDNGATQDPSGKPLYDRATLENRGYTYNEINGNEYWVKEVAEPNEERKSGEPLFEEY